MEDVPCSATSYGWIATYFATYSLGQRCTQFTPLHPNGGTMHITSGRTQSEEVHHIEERRLDLDAFGDEFSLSEGLRSFYVRASGYILLVTIAAVICYSATL